MPERQERDQTPRSRRQQSAADSVQRISNRLLELREGRATVARVTEYTGIARDTIRRIEMGQAPTLVQMLLLAEAYQVAPSELFGYAGSGDVQSLDDAQRFRAPSSTFSVALAVNPVLETLLEGSHETTCRHDGTEWLFVLDGEVGLRYGRDPLPVPLAREAAYEFDAVDVHAVVNLGTTPARLLRRMSAGGFAKHNGGD